MTSVPTPAPSPPGKDSAPEPGARGPQGLSLPTADPPAHVALLVAPRTSGESLPVSCPFTWLGFCPFSFSDISSPLQCLGRSDYVWSTLLSRGSRLGLWLTHLYIWDLARCVWQEAREDQWVDFEAPVWTVKKKYMGLSQAPTWLGSVWERAGT